MEKGDLQYDLTAEVRITRIRNLKKSKEIDRVVLETPLTIFLNDHELTTLICSPDKLDCLAIGFLGAEGLLEKAADIVKISIDEGKGLVYVNTVAKDGPVHKPIAKNVSASGGGKGSLVLNTLDSPRSKWINASLQAEPGEILKLVDAMQDKALLFKRTGGAHSAALADRNNILFYNEDIGRHNAIDKVVGQCILENINLEDKILLSSGRISAEIILKGARLGLPIIVSRSAPTSLAVELAGQTGITLIGFARGQCLNIYAHAFRII